MSIPSFISYYGYTNSQVLDEFARVYFALTAEMKKGRAAARLERIQDNAIPNGGGEEAKSIVNDLIKDAEGNDQIIQQAKNLRSIRNG
jgi:hypothetical protein